MFNFKKIFQGKNIAEEIAPIIEVPKLQSLGEGLQIVKKYFGVIGDNFSPKPGTREYLTDNNVNLKIQKDSDQYTRIKLEDINVKVIQKIIDRYGEKPHSIYLKYTNSPGKNGTTYRRSLDIAYHMTSSDPTYLSVQKNLPTREIFVPYSSDKSIKI